MFSFIFGCPLGRFPPFHPEGPITAKGLEALWACGTARSLSLNLKKCRGVEKTRNVPQTTGESTLSSHFRQSDMNNPSVYPKIK
ncbi:uncharacterized protein LOC26535028 [Drosophila yakuba]|uniref:Uncharacterized protein n=1 Tax=Drosophila yakuba TaxID=7245 RepID=A0A0R1E1P6_DROYA|nr:uncharacterized protein LOC26535028 [Drosophila yakuba]KRK03192.1 uncharacterized protein Dyak_GE27847 [Drosophila yakuba]